jgi:two-component system, cell cycle response regulator DivK
MKPNILVVEDNPPNRELLSDWLDTEGFAVVTAENLEQAFAALWQQQIQAILLDVQLGTEDGLDLARWLRQSPELRNTPVIAVTAHAMMTDQARVMQAGCNMCVAKPIDFRLLRTQLDLCLPDHRSPD